jgi:hypothetical protein
MGRLNDWDAPRPRLRVGRQLFLIGAEVKDRLIRGLSAIDKTTKNTRSERSASCCSWRDYTRMRSALSLVRYAGLQYIMHFAVYVSTTCNSESPAPTHHHSLAPRRYRTRTRVAASSKKLSESHNVQSAFCSFLYNAMPPRDLENMLLVTAFPAFVALAITREYASMRGRITHT